MGRATLAKRAGVSLRAVDGILTGTERNPRLATIHAIARALGVSISVGAEFGMTEALSADEMRKERALEKAQRLATGVQASMGLEAQAIDAAQRASLVERTMHKLLAGSGRRLWED
jgi:transcriptional regulator with XRE-family HTH domain